MATASELGSGSDPYDLDRFVRAQEDDYVQALSEIRSGRKRSHWMWYIFPQFEGLGFSSTSRLYSIKSVAEAEAYLSHPVLGPRLLECTEAEVRVSILVLLDHPPRHLNITALNVNVTKFRSLFCWIILRDHARTADEAGGDLVSILVLLDHPPRHQAGGVTMANDVVSILVLLDHPPRRQLREAGAAGVVVSILVLLDHPPRRHGARAAPRRSPSFDPCSAGSSSATPFRPRTGR